MIEDLINPELDKLFQRRSAAIMSLLKSLEELPREQQFLILTSNLSVTRLEKLAKFQKGE